MTMKDVVTSLEVLGGLLCSEDLPCEDGELLYTLVPDPKKSMNILIRYGRDSAFVQVEDVVHVDRTSYGIEIDLKDSHGNLSSLTLCPRRGTVPPRI